MSQLEDGAGLFIKKNTQHNYVQVIKNSLFNSEKLKLRKKMYKKAILPDSQIETFILINKTFLY